jgi:hypothetical protein
MPVRLVAVKCPSCGRPLEGKTTDQVFLCQCGVLHTRGEDGPREMPYTIAAPNRTDAPPEALVYVPIWRLDSDVKIHHSQSQGGILRKWFGKDWKGGRIHIFVPGVDWDTATFKHWSATLTGSPPKVYAASTFGPYERLPVTLDEKEAGQLADFLILTFEAEKSGVLQNISYEVKVLGTALLYLPFDRSKGDLRPAF